MAKHATKPKQRRKAPGAAVYDLDVQTSDEEQLEDDFRSGKDKVSLKPQAEEDSDLGPDEEGVYDLSEEEDEDEDEDDDEEEEGEEEMVEAALAQGGKLAQLARQAKYLGEQLKKQRGLEEDGEEEDGEEGEPGPVAWGGNKRAYYDADEAEEEEDAEAEEAEAARLQAAQAAALAPDDYGLDEDTLAAAAAAAERRSSAAAAGPRPAGLAAAAAAAAAAGGVGGVTVEAVTKDLSALTSEEQMAVLTADAPELLGLLGELRTALEEVRHKVGPLLAEVRAGGLATAGGLSYLEAKHLLLLQYCACLVVYLLLKAEGRPVKDHPVIGRLVQLRSYLERVRPIDKQLAYQLDKLLRATHLARTLPQDGAADGAAAADELAARPNPAALVAKAPLVAPSEGEGGAGGSGVYRPPKLNPVAMEEDAELSRQERRRLKEAARKAQRSSLVRDLAAELAGAPEEAGAGGALGTGLEDSAAAVAAAQRMAARSAAEEELMVRVPLSKAEAKKLRAARRAGLSGGGLLDDFADEVADLVASAGGAGAAGGGAPGGSSSLVDLFTKQRLSQKFGADLLAPGGQQQQQHRSGDADLPQRASLGERRAAYDAVAARRAAAGGGEGDEDMEGADEEFFGGGGGDRKRGRGEEDEFYSEAAAARSAAKAARKGKYAASELAPPLPDAEVSGQRRVNTAILKNRGLTPHRRKDLKNPRKKNRIKFAQASTRRKGQVQGVRPAQAGGYGGEATGIKAKVSKSTRLG